jgi:hypothetical protein
VTLNLNKIQHFLLGLCQFCHILPIWVVLGKIAVNLDCMRAALSGSKPCGRTELFRQRCEHKTGVTLNGLTALAVHGEDSMIA